MDIRRSLVVTAKAVAKALLLLCILIFNRLEKSHDQFHEASGISDEVSTEHFAGERVCFGSLDP